LEKTGAIRPGVRNQERINAHAGCLLPTAAKVPSASATLPASSRVRGKVSFVCLDHGNRTKSPRVGYAPSELQKKHWSLKALIEGWSPHLCGAQNRFYDDWKATRATLCKQSPIASLTRRPPCSDTHPLSCRRDAARSKTKNLRCREKFVLDLTFDRRRENRAIGHLDKVKKVATRSARFSLSTASRN
jgi:hypothetical protein